MGLWSTRYFLLSVENAVLTKPGVRWNEMKRDQGKLKAASCT